MVGDGDIGAPLDLPDHAGVASLDRLHEEVPIDPRRGFGFSRGGRLYSAVPPPKTQSQPLPLVTASRAP